MIYRIGFNSLAFACLSVVTACTPQNSLDVTSESQWEVPSSFEILKLLEERMAQNGVGVVVGVVDSKGRRVVANGISRSSDNRELDGDTVFQIGSLTKVATTLLLADMVERNVISLDDPAYIYMPLDIEMSETGRSITLKHLATHMSGLPAMPSNFDMNGVPDPYEAYTVDQMYEFISTYSFSQEPGYEWSYSNLGVSLLGKLLSNRVGIKFEELLKQRILHPLGMESTSINLNDDQFNRLAPGHDVYLQPVHSWEMKTLSASGSLRSTANDMLSLLEAYLGYKDTDLESAIQLQLNERLHFEDRDQALGWIIRTDGIIRHSGGKQGYRSGIAINLKLGIGVVVLANARTSDLPQNIALHLATGESIAPALPAPIDKPRVDLDRELLDSYVGEYQFSSGVVFEVARHQSHLIVRYPSGAILEFLATKPHEFFYNAGNDDIEFEVGFDGSVNTLILYGDGKKAGSSSTAQRVKM